MTHYRNCACYDCRQSRARRRATVRNIIGALFCAAVIVAWLCFIVGCAGTVTPAVVDSQQASFDQGGQNSGFLGWLPNNAGGIFTPRARDRYNALIAIYGRDFLPPLELDAGVFHRADDNYDLTAAAMYNFDVMSKWHRMGREPKNK